MGRFVAPKSVSPVLASDDGTREDFLSRIAKYVPTEIVAGFVFLNGLLVSASAGQLPGDRWWWHLFAFLLCWILTPIYLAKRPAPPDQPRRLQMILSSVAFPIWAYAVGGGVFASVASGVFASILLAVFTLVSGAFQPSAGDK